MHERTQERQDLQEELTALRRQARDPSASGRDASSCTGRCRLSAATRTPPTPRLHGVQDDIERLLDRYRGALVTVDRSRPR